MALDAEIRLWVVQDSEDVVKQSSRKSRCQEVVTLEGD